MFSSLRIKLQHLRERVVNRYWVAMRGTRRHLINRIFSRIHYSVEGLKNWIRSERNIESSKCPDSAYVDIRRINAPSYRPTQLVPLGSPPLQVDAEAVASTLQKLRASLYIPEASDP